VGATGGGARVPSVCARTTVVDSRLLIICAGGSTSEDETAETAAAAPTDGACSKWWQRARKEAFLTVCNVIALPNSAASEDSVDFGKRTASGLSFALGRVDVARLQRVFVVVLQLLQAQCGTQVDTKRCQTASRFN